MPSNRIGAAVNLCRMGIPSQSMDESKSIPLRITSGSGHRFRERWKKGEDCPLTQLHHARIRVSAPASGAYRFCSSPNMSVAKSPAGVLISRVSGAASFCAAIHRSTSDARGSRFASTPLEVFRVDALQIPAYEFVEAGDWSLS